MTSHRCSLSVFLVLAVAAGSASAQYSSSRQVRCESVNSREVACAIPDGKVAEFVEQNSRADCIRGRTYFIERDRIIVNQGCRATFRFVDEPYDSGLDSELRSHLAVELGRMIRNDDRLKYTPSVTIVSDRADPRNDNSRVVGYEGTANIGSSNGGVWKTVNFDASYDLRTRAFTRIDYDEAGYDDTNDRMDADAEAAIMRALADEVRRQKGGGAVQVAVNHRHRSTRSGGNVTYTGKFGYTWNDGEWVTRGYEAVVNPSGQQVRSVRLWKLQ